ncbi:MAG: transposase family protein [Candidatus Methanoplasma sp.]|jgi:transposase|nr:transposase family protein [Candidatus Methanoplasma sp.]
MPVTDEGIKAICGIDSAWNIVSVDVDHVNETFRISVDSDRRRFPCPGCGNECPVHDFCEGEWRGLDIGAYKTILQAKLPRTDCPECGVNRLVPDWAIEYSRRTWKVRKYKNKRNEITQSL